MRQKIIAIVGPTASGKTGLAKGLFKKFNGMVISIDSRQIYQKLDLGTGKDNSFHQEMIDIVKPETIFSVVNFQEKVLNLIKIAFKKGKTPFLVGGTGFYLDSILFKREYPHVPPDEKLRKKLNRQSIKTLYDELFNLDPKSALRCGKNKRRLVRALEINQITGKNVPEISSQKRFDCLILGIKAPLKVLYQRIDERIDERIKEGMIREVRDLIQSGVSSDWLFNLGLEYRFITQYFQAQLTREEMIEKLKFAIHAYARRQMTWWRRYKDIQWLKLQDFSEKQKKQLIRKAELKIENFLSEKNN